MKFLLLITTLLVTSSNLLADRITMTWPDPNSPVILSRSSTSDGVSMNPPHKYQATAKLKGPKREVSQFIESYSGYANANASLTIASGGLGKYFGAGTHLIDCFYNIWDRISSSIAPVVEAGTSSVCYVFVPNTCRFYLNDTYADYRRLDSAVPDKVCISNCTDNAYISGIIQPKGLNACIDRRTRYIYWVWTLLGGRTCYPEKNGGRWWGTEYCSSCGDKIL